MAAAPTKSLTVRSIFYAEIPDQPDALTSGASGNLELSDKGIEWLPKRHARRNHEALKAGWSEIFRAEMIPVEYGFHPTSYLVSLRTNQGPWWFGIPLEDARALREVLLKHLDLSEA